MNNENTSMATKTTPITSTSSTLLANQTATSGTSTPSSNMSAKPLTSNQSNPVVILDKQRLQELVSEIDSKEQLDEEVEDMLLNIADDFIDNLGIYILS